MVYSQNGPDRAIWLSFLCHLLEGRTVLQSKSSDKYIESGMIFAEGLYDTCRDDAIPFKFNWYSVEETCRSSQTESGSVMRTQWVEPTTLDGQANS
jgi:hypothetical protein